MIIVLIFAITVIINTVTWIDSAAFTNVVIHLHSYRDYSALYFQEEMCWGRSESQINRKKEGHELSKSILRTQGLEWEGGESFSFALRK